MLGSMYAWRWLLNDEIKLRREWPLLLLRMLLLLLLLLVWLYMIDRICLHSLRWWWLEG